MKILFSTSSLFPYRVEWLDELAKYFDVDIFYLKDDDADRVTEWCAKRPKNCSYTLMKSIKIPILGLRSKEFIKVLKKKANEYDFIILDGYGYYTQYLNIRYLNKKKIDYYVNIDGMVPKKNNWITRLIKKSIISKVPHFLCGSKETNKLLINLGSSKEKIVNHPFTSLREADILEKVPTDHEKKELRKKLAIKEKFVVISVGRFSYMKGYGKGYDVLIKAAKLLNEIDIGWYIVGGKPTLEFENIVKNSGLENIHFIDFLEKKELNEYYQASDVFALMTVSDVWGLVINEAMANGLPVITTNMCVAGLDLVKDYENGFIIDVGDYKALAERIKILFNDKLRKQMSDNSLIKIEKYTIEEMGRIHKEYFNEKYKK